MSPIIDLQRRMVEVGRIRMGHQVAAGKGTRPAKLEHWRLTGRDEARLQAAAALYGGEVRPWAERPGEFELFTTTAEFPILLIPGQTLSQWYETWNAGGCTRRCDGDRETISENPCVCDTEKGDRQCKPTTRLSVMLPDVPGLGCWRLESHGYYAAVELAGTSAMLEAATARGQLLPARLRIDQRSKIEGGKTTRYAVPVIDIDITVRQALPGLGDGSMPALNAPGFTPVPAPFGVTVQQGLDAVAIEAAPRASRGRQAAEIGPAPEGMFSSDPIPVDDTPPVGGEVINERQRALLWATCGNRGIAEPELRVIVLAATGQESTKLIPRDKFDEVLKALDRRPVPTADETLADQAAGAAPAPQPPSAPAAGEPTPEPEPELSIDEIKGLVDLLLAHGRERGSLADFEKALVANQEKNVDDLGAHVRWLRAQIARCEANPVTDGVPA